MAIDILSWNIKGFVGCVTFGGDRLTVIEKVMYQFDLIFIYEVPYSLNGNTSVKDLLKNLNAVGGGRTYSGIGAYTGGQDKEAEQVVVLFDTNKVTVVDTTNTRGCQTSGGRRPMYCNVTEISNGNTREFCAWHAPKPELGHLIAQDWNNIMQNSRANNRKVIQSLTSVIAGDFNAVLSVPPKRQPGGDFVRQIDPLTTSSTLKSFKDLRRDFKTPADYRTKNLYDQFFVDPNLVSQIGKSGLYDVLDRLVKKAAPFHNVTLKKKIATVQDAYDLYYGVLSDHLPVAITLTL